MTDAKPMAKDEVPAKLRAEIAEQRRAAEAEPDPARREQMLHDADTRDDLAGDEAEAIAEEIAESVPQAAISVRVPASLSEALKARASAEHIPLSMYVRRVLAKAVEQPEAPVRTVEQVEDTARRVCREPA
jgi:predicted DNA binding CopG/RHH family protein